MYVSKFVLYETKRKERHKVQAYSHIIFKSLRSITFDIWMKQNECFIREAAKIKAPPLMARPL